MGTVTKQVLSNALEQGLAADFERIASASYRDHVAFLDYEYRICSHVYTYEDEGIRGFFMVGEESYEGIEGKVVFLGLSCVAPEWKGMGIGPCLYKAFLEEALTLARGGRDSLHFWFRTASPEVCRAFWKLSSFVSPTIDGQFDPDLLPVLDAACRRHGMQAFRDPTSPYVLRGFASARYKEAERTRLRHADQSLLDVHRILESNGDRLLFVGRVPASEEVGRDHPTGASI